MRIAVLFLALFWHQCYASNLDVIPKASKDKGQTFFGLSTGMNFFAPYRDSGSEDINTVGNISSVFIGYAKSNLVIMGGLEYFTGPMEYRGEFFDIKDGNIRMHPELFGEINYFITREYFWQPYLIYSMSIGWEINNGTPAGEGVGNHYNVGMGVNFQINEYWSISLSTLLNNVKHQNLPLEMYMSFGVDIMYAVSQNLGLVYSVTYQTPRINNRDTSAERNMPTEIDLHGHSAIVMEFGIVFF